MRPANVSLSSTTTLHATLLCFNRSQPLVVLVKATFRIRNMVSYCRLSLRPLLDDGLKS